MWYTQITPLFGPIISCQVIVHFVPQQSAHPHTRSGREVTSARLPLWRNTVIKVLVFGFTAHIYIHAESKLSNSFGLSWLITQCPRLTTNYQYVSHFGNNFQFFSPLHSNEVYKVGISRVPKQWTSKELLYSSCAMSDSSILSISSHCTSSCAKVRRVKNMKKSKRKQDFNQIS